MIKKTVVDANTYWQHELILAVHSRTVAKITCMVLFQHLQDPPIGQNITGVNEAIEHLCSLLNQV